MSYSNKSFELNSPFKKSVSTKATLNLSNIFIILNMKFPLSNCDCFTKSVISFCFVCNSVNCFFFVSMLCRINSFFRLNKLNNSLFVEFSAAFFWNKAIWESQRDYKYTNEKFMSNLWKIYKHYISRSRLDLLARISLGYFWNSTVHLCYCWAQVPSHSTIWIEISNPI